MEKLSIPCDYKHVHVCRANYTSACNLTYMYKKGCESCIHTFDLSYHHSTEMCNKLDKTLCSRLYSLLLTKAQIVTHIM